MSIHIRTDISVGTVTPGATVIGVAIGEVTGAQVDDVCTRVALENAAWIVVDWVGYRRDVYGYATSYAAHAAAKYLGVETIVAVFTRAAWDTYMDGSAAPHVNQCPDAMYFCGVRYTEMAP